MTTAAPSALTFLQLAQRLALEAQTTISSASIAAVTGNTGMAARMVNWIVQAHRDIQNRHIEIWRWLRSSWSFDTVVGTDTYAYGAVNDTSSAPALITRFARWIEFDDEGASNVKIYLTSGGVGGQRWMTYLPWAYFRAIYRRGVQNNGVPVHFTVDPGYRLVIGPKPNDIYTIDGEYQKGPCDLVDNGDTPEFPAQYHDLVWQYALEIYGRGAAAAEAVARATLEGGRNMRALEAQQLPELGFSRPLA